VWGVPMSNPILDGLSLVDAFGQALLALNLVCLLAALGAHAFLRSRYRALANDLDNHPEPKARFDHPVLNRIVQEAEDDTRRSSEPNTQAIIEDRVQSDLRAWLVLERFVRAATALVLIIGLLGTFYGLTVSIGRLVHLVAADAGTTGDVTQALTRGLTQSLSGMAAAFSNSLVGVASAVVLSIASVVNNVTDQRTGLMLRIETTLARRLPRPAASSADVGPFVASFADAVHRLEGAVARFDEALGGLTAAARDVRELQLVVSLKPGGSR
jgi:hypothetical protein